MSSKQSFGNERVKRVTTTRCDEWKSRHRIAYRVGMSILSKIAGAALNSRYFLFCTTTGGAKPSHSSLRVENDIYGLVSPPRRARPFQYTLFAATGSKAGRRAAPSGVEQSYQHQTEVK